MLIAGVVCLAAAMACAVLGIRALRRPSNAEPTQQVLRAVAPTQLAAAVMFTAAGVVALAASPSTGFVVVVVCVLGAVGTVAAGSWQGARYALSREPATECAGSCAACTLSCR